MELFCALLTSFFLWVFFCHWHRSALVRAREMAGGLLIEVKAAGHVVQALREQRHFSFALMLPLFLILIGIQCWRQTFATQTLTDDFIATVFMFNLLALTFPPCRRDAPLELREHGVIRRKQTYDNLPGRLMFTPWNEITACKWCDKLPKRHVHPRHLLLERDVLPIEEIEAITAVAGRFVPVFDADGRLLAGPESGDEAAILREHGSGRLKFQFTLQSLLLLMVVVSCGASCYGIHYRRMQSLRDAVAKPVPVVAPPVKQR